MYIHTSISYKKVEIINKHVNNTKPQKIANNNNNLAASKKT